MREVVDGKGKKGLAKGQGMVSWLRLKPQARSHDAESPAKGVKVKELTLQKKGVQ